MQKLKKGVYLHEGKKGEFRLIYPIKKDIDKPYGLNNMNWFNFFTGGSWNKLFTLGFIIFMIIFLAWTYQHDVEAYKDVYSDPCGYCPQCKGTIYDNQIKMPDISLENLEVDNERGNKG